MLNKEKYTKSEIEFMINDTLGKLVSAEKDYEGISDPNELRFHRIYTLALHELLIELRK